MNILIIDDEKMVLEGVEEYLNKEGYNVFAALSGEEGINLFNNNSIDLIILDIKLPEKSGFEVLREIRRTSSIPVIILSAASDEKTQLAGFDLAADDYVTKPFSLPVLSKRIQVLLNRYYGEHNIWSYKDASVDFTSYKAIHSGKEVDIKPKELDVLKSLLHHPNQVLSRGQIIEQVWSDVEEIPLERVIDVYIKNLRKKLGLDCIVTIKNVGYKLKL
ncbi:response regulator transcription factor [Gemella cuniculi]|uniref:response regulator transcription factor n=1 Tax=Gemella cuniculi TaxID=150240 RepID=UPI0004009FDB|nr:response regulator transcription factor [Gemella cuniculi]